jgi:hypothetical protein
MPTSLPSSQDPHRHTTVRSNRSFSALVLGYYEDDFPKAVAKALYAVQMVLYKTNVAAGADTSMRARELRIIQEQVHLTSHGEWPGACISAKAP